MPDLLHSVCFSFTVGRPAETFGVPDMDGALGDRRRDRGRGICETLMSFAAGRQLSLRLELVGIAVTLSLMGGRSTRRCHHSVSSVPWSPEPLPPSVRLSKSQE